MAIQVRQVDRSPSQLGHVTGVRCTQCGTYTPLSEMKESFGTTFVYACDRMDGGELLPVLDLKRLSNVLDPRVTGRDVARQRYENSPTYLGLFPELLPLVWDDGKPRVHVRDFPFSSLNKSIAIGSELGVELYFLDEGSLPTGSFKDRAVAMAINIAVESGYNRMYVASTGNLVLSSLQIGSDAGIYVHALLPEALSPAKKAKVSNLIQSINGNGRGIEVSYHPFTYDYINYIITSELIDRHNRNGELHRAFSPNRGPRTWYGMGEWTAAFQLFTQLYYQHGIEEGKPINIYIGGGSGKLTCMMTEASKVLQDLGILKNPVRIWSVQPTINQPLVQGYTSQVLPALLAGKSYDNIKNQINPIEGENPQGTIVESVAIGKPGSFLHTMKSLAHPNSTNFSQWKKIRGGAVAVPDEETLDGLVQLVEREQLTPQFVGAMAYQGFRQAIARHPELGGEIHVVYLTGGGKGKLRLTLEEMAQKDWGGRGAQLARITPFF